MGLQNSAYTWAYMIFIKISKEFWFSNMQIETTTTTTTTVVLVATTMMMMLMLIPGFLKKYSCLSQDNNNAYCQSFFKYN